MAARDPSLDAVLRCSHCGRPVRETEHTRTSYRVDYYTLHSGHGELCSIGGDDRQHAITYIRLFDRFDVVTCVECYRQPAVRADRDRQFQPERDAREAAREEA